MAAILVAAVLATGRARAQDIHEPPAAASETGGSGEGGAVANGPAYSVRIVGDIDDKLRALLEESSQLRSLRDRPPASPAALRRRIADDVARFATVLRSEGYYAHRIESAVREDEQPAAVEIAVEPGPIFLLADYAIEYRPVPPAGEVPRELEDLDLRLGMPARARPLAAAKAKILTALADNGYPFAEVVEERFVADHSLYALSGRIVVATGPESRFGELRVSGLDRLHEDYLRRVVAWQPGERYDRRKVEALRRKLYDMDLFEAVSVTPAEAPDAEGRVAVEVSLSERAPRTVGVGAGYATDVGPSVRLFWEHRNLLGRQERLRLEGDASQPRQEASARLRKPNFLRLDQTWLNEATVAHEDSEAFKELSTRFFTGLERSFGAHWTVSLGPAIEFSRLHDNAGTDRFALLGLIGTATYDSRDNLLNPTEGAHVSVGAAPYLGAIAESTNFVSTEMSGASYFSLLGEDKLVLATRVRLGSIVGSEREDVPANKRFYSGGGGSVRGYEFRRLGPLDAGNDPIGGRSVLELSFELRTRFFDDIGIVPFIDGGQVYEDSLPDFNRELLWAAGLGFRYFTAIGPVRVDIARPINPRRVDEDFQLYFSVGQAF